MRQRTSISLRRLPVSTLFPPLLVMTVVISLLLFLYSDTPRPPRHQRQHSDVRSASPKMTSHRRRHVFLLSLARSGSSLVGNILSHATGVYYVFEPLKKAEDLYWNRTSGNTSKGKAPRENFLEQRKNQQEGIIHNFLSCDFSDLDLSLLERSFLRRSARTWPLEKCMDGLNASTMALCINEAERMCRKTHTSLLKVIRPRLRDLLPLMTRDPDLKVILLVRDLRASLWSRVTVFKKTPQWKYSQLFKDQCHRHLDDDLTTLHHLPPPLLNRTRLLRYETLARDPIRISKLLYNYLGLKWTHHVNNQIQIQTSSAKMDNNGSSSTVLRQKVRLMMNSPYSVVRRDSLEASQAWRKRANWTFVDKVQKKCFGVLRRLGYVLFRSEDELRDTAFASYQPDDVDVNASMWFQ